MQEGRGRVTEEGPQLRTPAGAGSHHQMAVPKMHGLAHGTRRTAGTFRDGGDPRLPAPPPNPGAETPEPGTHCRVPKRKQKQTKTTEKCSPLVFIKFQS